MAGSCSELLQGDPAALLASVGLDPGGIAKAIRQRFGNAEPRLVVNRH